MTTLTNQSPLRALAHILHAASVVGSGAWERGDDRQREPPSGSAFTHDLHALFALLRERKLIEALRPYVAAGEFAELQRIVGEIEQRLQRMQRRGA